MIKLKCDGEIYEFKNWREAHRALEPCPPGSGCVANYLEGICDYTEVSDFGVLIGKKCVLEIAEEIEQKEGKNE